MNENDLKQSYLSWLDSIKIRRCAYDSSKFYLRQAEENLRIAKKVHNRTYNDWKTARLEAEKSKQRWKRQPYRLRQWAKQNWDKVFLLIEEQNKQPTPQDKLEEKKK